MNIKSISIGVVSFLCVGLIGVAPAAAVTKGTPPKPVISVIRSSPASKGKVNITFVIAATASKNKPASTVVVLAYLSKSCIVRGKAKSCTIKNIDKGWELAVTARSKNSKGYGSWSKSLSFVSGRGTFIRTGYNSAGVKFPSPISMTNKSRILGNSSKWTKFQPLKRKGVGSAGLRQAKVPATISSSNVVFQVSGIVGLAQTSSNSTCGATTPGAAPGVVCTFSVGMDGSSLSVYATGSATPGIRDFYSAPNNKFYVVFNSASPLVSGGPNCALAEVNTDTGIPTCVDSELTSVTMGYGSMFGPLWIGNAPIQFDDAGNIYYTGTSTGYSFTLRKNVNGVITQLVRDNVTVSDYVVLGDGSIIMAGRTLNTQVSWIRKVSAGTGAITNLVNGVSANFLRKFADKNIYYGVPSSGTSTGGVYRYSVSQGKTDTLPWIGQPFGNSNASQNDTSGLCSFTDGNRSSVFCSMGGSMIREIFNIGTEKTMAIVGATYGASSTELMQYYPTIERANTVITLITMWHQVGNKLLLSGTDKDQKNVLSLYDPQTFQETILLDASNEIEIYNLGYVASTNKVMFNGLKFADGQYVVGDISLS
jgi:hypothetical protein